MRVVTDNGANYRAQSFIANITSLASRHQRIRPYTPRHNGKVERYNRILAEECLYTRTYTSQQQRHDAVAAPTRRPAAQKSRTLSTWDDFETAFRMWSRPVTL
ncbi:integrase core domain protein [Actinomyces naeslundii str. Howell 279]|uniref:Integrase core domain protein n=1 Tax=Actinomyces naeslundii (strain ATCC 12104 / DSM 43013 / CCUG 2238 / JCM 8349 / NCTC 10301 / Howell 279) TaxID=1115803 RepID=J3F218_ACTNH|nr:integrase core domain protein [Actinomyces naeslundii str. Howell 279]